MPTIAVGDVTNPNGLAAGLNLAHRKYAQGMLGEIFAEMKAERFMASRAMVLDKDTVTETTIGDLIQRWACSFDPKGDMAFQPRDLEVCRLKIDREVGCLEALHKSYLSEMFTSADDFTDNIRTYSEWYQTRMYNKIGEEMEIAALRGWKDDSVPQASSNYLNSVDGIGTIAERLVNNGTVISIPTGPLTPGSTLDKVEDFFASIPNKVRRGASRGILWMSEANYRQYWQDRRAAEYNQNCCDNKDAAMRVEYFNVDIEWFEGLDGSDLIFYTPANNVVKLFNITEDPRTMRFNAQPFNRTVKYMADFKRGYNFLDIRYVYVNDQPLHGPTNV